MSKLKTQALQEAARLESKFGHKTGSVGSASYKLNVVPTGTLALDYALGTGGWPLGHPVEVFGAPDIGKSSIIGFNAIKNAQKLGMLCGIIALEPGFDKGWAFKHGVDPDMVVIARPDNGEVAFEILHDWVQDDVVDFIVFDSIGAVVAEAERKEGAKVKVGGQSPLITMGIKRILQPAWKHNKGVILLNQQRDDMDSRIPGVKKSPGGNAVHHSAAIRVQLKTTGKPFKKTIEGDDVEIGRTLVAIIKRNKLSEGSSKRAEFDFYQMETEEHPIGIDTAKDIVATAIRTGAIQKAGGYYRHSSFPKDKKDVGQIQGKENVYDFLLGNDKVVEEIRKEVINVMLEKLGSVKNISPEEDEGEGEG